MKERARSLDVMIRIVKHLLQVSRSDYGVQEGVVEIKGSTEGSRLNPGSKDLGERNCSAHVDPRKEGRVIGIYNSSQRA